MATTISVALVAAYRTTDYRVDLEGGTFTLRVGEYSPELARLLATTTLSSAGFITAYNPYSIARNDAENRAAHASLRDSCAAMGLRIIDGVGVGRTGDWPGEASLLVLGLDLAAAQRLGEDFGQNAIIWVGSDAVPQLILLA